MVSDARVHSVPDIRLVCACSSRCHHVVLITTRARHGMPVLIERTVGNAHAKPTLCRPCCVFTSFIHAIGHAVTVVYLVVVRSTPRDGDDDGDQYSGAEHQ